MARSKILPPTKSDRLKPLSLSGTVWLFLAAQFVKLGVSRYLGDRLTENFLIWDLDMILMKSIEVFTQDDLPKAMINVGGKIHIHKGYELNYENLTNRT